MIVCLVVVVVDPLRSLLMLMLMLLHVLPHHLQRSIRREGLVAIRSGVTAIQPRLIPVQLERTRCVAPVCLLLMLLLLHEVREIALQLAGHGRMIRRVKCSKRNSERLTCRILCKRIHCVFLFVASRVTAVHTRPTTRVGIAPLTSLLLQLVRTGLQYGWRSRLQKGQLLVQHPNIFQLFIPNPFTPLQIFLLRLERWTGCFGASTQGVQFAIGRCERKVALGDLQCLFCDLLLRCSELRSQSQCAGGGGER